MALVLVAWVLVCVLPPCILAFRASYPRKGRMMLILIGLFVLYTFATFMGGLMPLSTQPITPDAAYWSTISLTLLLFGSSGAGIGLLVGGLGGWIMRVRL